MNYRKELKNGIKILVEEMPRRSSVAVSIWIRRGSRDEKKEEGGISHFIEHMLFKGTKTRTAIQIAREMDEVGGELNAFTGKECTCLYATVLKEHFSFALNLLGDLFLNSLFKESELEKEKGVLLEEIKMHEDSPREYIHDLLAQTIFSRHSLGQPISGTREVVKKIKAGMMREYFQQNYTPEKLVISIAGAAKSKKEIIRQVEDIFAGLKRKGEESLSHPPRLQSCLHCYPRQLNQIHLCMGIKGIPFNHKFRYIFSLLTLILGGGMSSRLFQKIREKLGLAYAIYAYLSPFKDSGYLGIYAGVDKDNLFKTLKMILEEINKLKEKKVSFREIERAKKHLKGNLLLGLESTSARASRLAQSEIYFNRMMSIKEILAGIEAVGIEDIQKIAQEYFSLESLSLATLGPVPDKDRLYNILPLRNEEK